MPENALKKFWNFLWNDNSLLSWIISLILAFIIVKFILFPLLMFAAHSTLPLVVVESGSMHHPGNFLGNWFSSQGSFNTWWTLSGSWYTSRNITKEQASSWSLRTGIEKGDIIIVSGWDKNLSVGNIIIFNAGTQYPIIHRIVKINDVNGTISYQTKGDNNPDQIPGIETNIPQTAIIGKAVFKIPLLGWLKLWVTNLLGLLK